MASNSELLFSEQTNESHDSDIDKILLSIEEDFMSDTVQSRTAAMEALEIVLQKCERSVPTRILQLVSITSSDPLKVLVIKKLEAIITRAVKETQVDYAELFSFDEAHQTPIVSLYSEVFDILPTDVLKKFLCDVIIPGMFNTNLELGVRSTLINMGFRLITKCPITAMSSQEIKLFTSRAMEKYTKVLENLREQNYTRWHDLWIFLVRYSGKHLHVAMDLANKLLRVVEYAFRNPSYEQRLKGYDCWKEQIDNASLDMKHMCSNKQVKLLVTPLRAKFSKMEVVICKRFEVFLYLLEKLQNQAVLCLNEFLEFCFGISHNTNNSSKNGQGKLVPSLWLKSIQVFLAILGDQTYISATLNKSLFEGPVINETNIGHFDQAIICSVIESSILLKHVSIDVHEKTVLMSSLWEALFNILMKSSQEIQEKCFQTIFGSLSIMFKEFNEDLTYIGLFSAFTQLNDSSIDYRLISDSLKLLLEYALKFLCEEAASDEFCRQFHELVQVCCLEDHIIEFLIEQLKKIEVSKNGLKILELWTFLGKKLVANAENYSKILAQFFMWPVNQLQYFKEGLAKDVCSKWTELLVKISKKSKNCLENTMNELERTLKSNPLLSSNIATLISSLDQEKVQFDDKNVKSTLKLMSNILSLPLISQNSAEKLNGLIMRCTQVVADSEATEVDAEVVGDICQCIEKIPNQKKTRNFNTMLEKVAKKVKSSDVKTESRLRKLMTDTNVLEKETRSPSTHSKDTTNGQSPGSLSRSVKMTQMAFSKPGLEPNQDKVNALQLFGKNINTMTPLKVKGSLLQRSDSPSPNSRCKKMVNAIRKQHIPEPPSIEDQNCDFVLIDTEVKLQKDKLTEHQKEELRRRREDIPALYQDLSQSQTQSQSSGSKDTFKTHPAVEEKPGDVEDGDIKKQEDHEENVCSTDDNYIADETKNLQEPKVGTSHRYFETLKKIDDNDSNTDSNESTSKGMRKSGKFMRELMRIKMDIVGGDTSFNDLPSKRQRKPVEKINSTPKEKKVIKVKKGEDKEQKNDIDVGPEIEVEKAETKTEGIVEEPKEEIVIEVPKEETLQVLETSHDVKKGATETQPSPSKTLSKRKSLVPKKFIRSPEKKAQREALRAKRREEAKKLRLKLGASYKRPKRETLFSLESDWSTDECQVIKEVKAEKSPKISQTSTPAKAEPSITSVFEFDDSDAQSTQASIEKPSAPSVNIDGKKRPKEIMKKNKEKVRTIQSQLKLANLGNLSNSTEPKKTKNAKLIFIREITNSKNQESKVSAAGLKRNKDDKSKNIAYTIETPAVSIDLASLNLNIKPAEEVKVQPSVNEAPEKKQAKKRKRATSENDDVQDSETSPMTAGNAKENVTRKSVGKLSSTPNSEDKGQNIKKRKSKGPSENPANNAEPGIVKPNKPKKRRSQQTIVELLENNVANGGLAENSKLPEITDIKPLPGTPVKKAKNTEKKRQSIKLESGEKPPVSHKTDAGEGIKINEVDIFKVKSPGPSAEKKRKSREKKKESQIQVKEPSGVSSENSTGKDPHQEVKKFDVDVIKIIQTVRSAMSKPVIDQGHPTEGTRVDEINEISIEDIATSPNKKGKVKDRRSSDSPKKKVGSPEESTIESLKTKSKTRNSPKMSSLKTSPNSSPTRVTRSRSWSLSPMPTAEKATNPEPLRAVKSLFPESEDVIESSQGSFADNNMSTSVGNVKRKLPASISIVSPKTKAKIDDDATSSDVESPIKLVAEAETETCESNFETCSTRIHVERPERPELTDSELALSRAETISIASQSDDIENCDTNLVLTGEDALVEKSDVAEGEPFNLFFDDERVSSSTDNPIEIEILGTPEKKAPSDLPGSPVNNVTPTLTRELLDNTLDISPINSQELEQNEEVVWNETSDKFEGNSKETRGSVQKTTSDVKTSKSRANLNLRSNKLLNMVNVESPVSHRGVGKRVISSPACTKTRYEKLFSFFNENKGETEKVEEKTEELSNYTGNADDILTFSREVPSPLATPSSSILKRKLQDNEDGYSPCPKRKRVNFSYPCISSTKLYIRHKEELNTRFKLSYPNDLFENNYDEENSEDEDPFANPPEYLASEESMDITNSLLLCRKKPIYEQLVDCEDSLDVLWKRISSAVYAEALKKVLQGKDIHTVGDLASLSESEISRLPFKTPRVKTVRKALNFYYTHNLKKPSKSTTSEQNELNSLDVVEEVSIEPISSVREENNSQQFNTVRDMLIEVLIRIRKEKIPLDKFGETFLDFLDETQVINLLKHVYNTDFKQFFKREHWRCLVENIVQLGGTSELFDIISDLAENNDVFADQLENIVQLRIEQNPLKNIICKRTLVDLHAAIHGCIMDGVFETRDVVQTCLLPLIKSPSDIENYFKTLTIVQVNDLFIKRVDTGDLKVFFDQIREHYGNYTLAQCAKKDDVLKICSKEELVTTLSERDNEVKTIKDLVSTMKDRNRLVDLYKYIGNLIPLKSRLESHIDFLKRIPFNDDSMK